MTDPIEPIAPEEARNILHAAIRERLGENWQDDPDGWTLVTSHAYMARLNKGRTNIDFYVDLLGSVTVQEKEVNAGQEAGRMLAWLLLGLSLAIAFLIARISGLV